ncbi:MAG: hypothetical protein MUE52_02045 [Tabrizicola sp.]|nr:hypothetical protein [Tabrizicola sp.]
MFMFQTVATAEAEVLAEAAQELLALAKGRRLLARLRPETAKPLQAETPSLVALHGISRNARAK